MRTICTLVIIVSSLSFTFADSPIYSDLWGERGESWTAESRLPDFSYAGYHRGERPLPSRAADVSVKDFAAVGDGKTDDTRAFQRAIDRSRGKTIAVPPGVYVITDILQIRDSGTVLQGTSSRESILRFPIPLNEIHPNWGATTTGRRTSNYSWSGGFISVSGSPAKDVLAKVSKPAERGSRQLDVSSVDPFHVGDDVCLELSDTEDQTLARYLYANDPGPLDNLGSRASVTFAARVTGVDTTSKRIEFDRPLRTEVRPEWQPKIYAASCSVEEVGIEKIGFEFPLTPYAGHFTEVGFNALTMSGVRNCWARELRIRNADSGIFISGRNVTVDGLDIESERKPERTRQATGHHGVTLGGQDNLLTNFDYRTRFMHDITVTRGSAGNVASDGRGLDVCFDHHCYAPHANLFTNIDLGKGTRMFQSGGGAKLGRHSAAWETFWCIRSQSSQQWPKGWSPDRINIIGVKSTGESELNRSGRWFEPIDPTRLQPANLHQSQLQRRLKNQNQSAASDRRKAS